MSERDELAELIHGGPLRTDNTVGALYEMGCAYQRADAILARWRLVGLYKCAYKSAHDDIEDGATMHCGMPVIRWDEQSVR